MKRSEINQIIKQAQSFLAERLFCLPPWAYWESEDWRGKGGLCAQIVHNQLGWDVTDFGSGDFNRCGLTLFTLRNGHLSRNDPKPYAEKVMVVQEDQETPMHFHWKKMEDIINRGGGNLVVELYASSDDENLGDDSIEVSVDGIQRTVEAGGRVILEPGESICLERHMYHRFYGEAGKGLVLVGEVSQVNDDSTDNRFHGDAPRFPDIEEDERPVHLLVGDYPDYV